MKIHLIEGPVGAGKSTYAIRLARELGAVRMNLDEWMVTLFSRDRPATNFTTWYNERKQRCIEQIWLTTRAVLDAKTEVVLELGLVTSALREAFYQRADQHGCLLTVTVLEAPREERWRRVQQRNEGTDETFRMFVSEEIFQIADAAWQAPDSLELKQRQIKQIKHY
ncbi:MAG: ATP-binding protein [Pseudomonadota bacterium]